MRRRTVSQISNWMDSHASMKRMFYHPVKTNLNLLSEDGDDFSNLLSWISTTADYYWYKVIGDRRTESTYTMSTITDFDHGGDWTVFLK